MSKTKAEILRAKREKEKARYKKIREDPVRREEERMKAHQKYLNRKNKKQVVPIIEMTDRQKRAKRKQWKNNTKNYRKAKNQKENVAQMLHENTPPTSDDENLENNDIMNNRVNELEENRIVAKREAARKRKERSRQIKEFKSKIQKLESKVAKYKKRIQRANKKKPKNTPKTNVSEMLNSSTIDNEKREQITKNLLFAEVMKDQLNFNLQQSSSQKHKQTFTRAIAGKVLKKYKLLKYCTPFLPRRCAGTFYQNNERKLKYDKEMRNKIKDFLELDLNSRVCPGKKDFVRMGKICKQKRFLNNSMKNLYSKFIKDYSETLKNISYSFFCKCRPFWIKFMKVSDRETCKCIIHANIELITHSMFSNELIQEHSTNDIIKTMCCQKEEMCLLRRCNKCSDRLIKVEHLEEVKMISYYKWVSINEDFEDKKTNKIKTVRRTVKKLFEVSTTELKNIFELEVPKFLHHEGYVIYQFNEIRKLKLNLKESEAIIHMDFSENYAFKYAEETQSFHFGGSRKQITLHTVVTYTKTETGSLSIKSYCTLSESLLHNASAIFAHLKPIFQEIEKRVPNISTIHFISDGPSTQYRNKTMFYFMALKMKDFYSKMITFTWNYSEAGHGKGAPDGIGGVCKRTADRLVAEGNDLVDFDSFTAALLNNCPGVIFYTITANDIELISKEIDSKCLKQFQGTMKVHQVVGNTLLPELNMRKLSCFECSFDCNHYSLGYVRYLTEKSKEREEETDDAMEVSDSESIRAITSTSNSTKLNIEDVYTSSSEDEQSLNISPGSFVLVQFIGEARTQTKYRYAAVCQEVEDDDIKIMCLKSTNKKNDTFKLIQDDISFVSSKQIIKILPTPAIVLKGNREFYVFEKKIDINEKSY